MAGACSPAPKAAFATTIRRWRAEKLEAGLDAQVREIAQTKLVDLNTDTVDAAMRIIEGTARSMGIDVVS